MADLKSHVKIPERFQPVVGWFTYIYITSPNDKATVIKNATQNAQKESTEMQTNKLCQKMFCLEL